jgi:hypothetical protein
VLLKFDFTLVSVHQSPYADPRAPQASLGREGSMLRIRELMLTEYVRTEGQTW